MRYRLSLLIAFALACGAPQAPSRAPLLESAPSDSLPEVGVQTLAGEGTDLRAVVRGRVALVSFWATWCEGCEREMDALNRLHARTTTRSDAIVVGVAVGNTRDEVAAFTQRRGLQYAQLVDPEFHLADALAQRRVPATLVVDRRGRIVFRGEALDAASLAAFRQALDSHD